MSGFRVPPPVRLRVDKDRGEAEKREKERPDSGESRLEKKVDSRKFHPEERRQMIPRHGRSVASGGQVPAQSEEQRRQEQGSDDPFRTSFARAPEEKVER